MFSKTEMFLSDQFLSTCWKCCCFWTPMSWCCPFSPTLTLQSWHRLRYFSLLSTDPFQKFLLPTQPLAGHSVTPTLQSHLCFERNSSGMTWSPWKWNGFFLCHWATGFPGSQKLCGQRAACSPSPCRRAPGCAQVNLTLLETSDSPRRCWSKLCSGLSELGVQGEREQSALAGKGHFVCCALTPNMCVCKWCWDRGISTLSIWVHKCQADKCLRGGAAMNGAGALSPGQSNLQWGHFSRKSNQVITGNQGLLNTGIAVEAKGHHLSSWLWGFI